MPFDKQRFTDEVRKTLEDMRVEQPGETVTFSAVRARLGMPDTGLSFAHVSDAVGALLSANSLPGLSLSEGGRIVLNSPSQTFPAT
ncbi:TPA: hypothetical protein ACIRVE_005088 [Pseudomonas putida]